MSPEANDITDAFKEAMRRLAATVTVVTARCGDERQGLTATAVCSVSMEPPQLLVCVNREAATHACIEKSGAFCVNILAQDQKEISNVFASPVDPNAPGKFEQVGEWDEAGPGVPCLRGAAANVVCELAEAVEGGTHTIFIGRVIEARAEGESAPLLYAKQGYVRLGPDA